MQCGTCGNENRPDANFCSRCGSSLALACPVCSATVVPGDAFCSNCGSSVAGTAAPPAGSDLTRYIPEALLAKIRSARSGRAMQGERRTVTMLFADIAGSTAAAEGLDPEDWAEVVNGAFEHLIAPVYRYEGTLARLQGDAVLAFFGAPIAHEDDPVRAVRAGLEIVAAFAGYREGIERRWGFPVEVRVGVNTGLVVVGEVGSDLRVEYTALGDAINVAARMEQTADPGTVRVAAGTLALTGDMFEAVALGPVDVKGKSEPVQAFRVVRFVPGAGRETARPPVGRAAELEVLDDLRTRLLAGSGWIASVIGEGGIGKSKLLGEFRRRTEGATDPADRFDAPGSLHRLFGASRSYDSANPFSAVRDLLRRWWREDHREIDFSRLEAAAGAAGLEDPDAAAFLAHIAGIGLPEAPAGFIDALETPVLHIRVGEVFAGYLEALARSHPTLVVLEDLHWADDLSLALVHDLMGVTERAPLGLVVAMRPYRDEPTWRIHETAQRDHHHRYTHIDLSPLAASDGDTLLDELLGEQDLPAATRRRILERADGNPLFIEEMVRALREEGGGETTTVPTSLTGILTARLDRLDDESRFVVQMASVLGSEFERDMLDTLAGGGTLDRHVTDLLRRGIFREGEGPPGTLAFRHALIQETAYGTVLRRTRRELHRRVAEQLIASRPGSVQAIAHHLMEADDALAAFPYLIEAGTRASRAMALADAIDYLTTAVENTPPDAPPALVEQAHDALGEAYALVPDLSRAAATYQRLYEYGERAERPSARVAALNRLGFATASLGADLGLAADYLERARLLAEECNDDVGLAEYHMNSCFVASLGGHIDVAAAHDEATIELGEKGGMDRIRLAGLVRRAMNYTGLLEFDRAEEAIASGLAAAEEAGAEEDRAIVLAFGAGMLARARGDLRGALETLEEAQPTLARYASFYAAMNQLNIGIQLYELGDLEGALGRFVDARRAGAKLGQAFVTGTAAAAMALVYATAGMSESVPGLRAEALEALALPMGGFLANLAWADLGFAALHLGDHESAAEDFARGLAASSVLQFEERPRLLIGHARALTAGGDLDSAGAALEEARALTRASGQATFDALLALATGEVARLRGDLAGAAAALAGAQATAMDRGQSLLLADILVARARVAADAGDAVEAAGHATAAAATIDTIAARIADEELRSSYSRRRREVVDSLTA